jgi:hypothetical protein
MGFETNPVERSAGFLRSMIDRVSQDGLCIAQLAGDGSLVLFSGIFRTT